MAGTELSVVGEQVLPSLSAAGAQLGLLAPDGCAGGVVLGVSASRGEIVLDLIRAVPTRVTLLCEDPWLARLLAVRFAGTGSPAVIATDRATVWQHINIIGGRHHIATVRTDHASALPAPGVAAPLVVIDDTRDIAPQTYAPRTAWQTTVHVRAGVDERSRTLLASSQAILICRLLADPAAAVSTTLGLGPGGAATVTGLADSEVLVIAERRALRVTVTPTATERRILAMR